MHFPWTRDTLERHALRGQSGSVWRCGERGGAVFWTDWASGVGELASGLCSECWHSGLRTGSEDESSSTRRRSFGGGAWGRRCCQTPASDRWGCCFVRYLRTCRESSNFQARRFGGNNMKNHVSWSQTNTENTQIKLWTCVELVVHIHCQIWILINNESNRWLAGIMMFLIMWISTIVNI